jgi:hypothetical protein
MPGLDVLKQYLLQIDEVQILELLDLSTEDLINAFEEKIVARREYLEREMEVYIDEENQEINLHDSFEDESDSSFE